MPLVKEINSLQNSRIKSVVRLREKRARDQRKLMLIDGCREVLLAYDRGIVFMEIYLCKDFISKESRKDVQKMIRGTKAIVCHVNRKVFEKISFGNRKDGVLVVAKQPLVSWNDLHAKQSALYVVLETVEKPGNLGAILRTANAAGVDGVFVCDSQTDIYNPNVVCSSCGAIFLVKIVKASSKDVMEFFKKQRITICAATPDGDVAYSKVSLSRAVAIILGSEHEGLSSFWIKNADIKTFIPMTGQVDSLNVSTTAAILIYEAFRQRQK